MGERLVLDTGVLVGIERGKLALATVISDEDVGSYSVFSVIQRMNEFAERVTV